MNIFEVEDAIRDAESTIRNADHKTRAMVRLITNRLRSASSDSYQQYQYHENLCRLKRELRDFNMITKSWKR